MLSIKEIILLTILIVITVFVLPISASADNCFNCHTEIEEAADAPSKLIHLDVHFKAGLGCADCHGGDSTRDDMDAVRKSSGYRGAPGAKEIPQFCASCHGDASYMVKHNPGLPTDQLEKYKTSVHGKRLFEKGDIKVANCVSCHSVHNIEGAKTPTSTVYAQNIPKTCAKCHANAEYMKEYGIPTNQYDDYLKSVHGAALLVNKDNTAPACNDCHGNHAATPPGVTSLAAVCGICHALVADNFAKSPHKKAFDELGFPECEKCHSNHLIVEPKSYWVGTSDSSLCAKCHEADDGTRGFAVANEMHDALAKMDRSYNDAVVAINEADQRGMMVTDEKLNLNEVKQAIIQAATEVHTSDAKRVAEITQAGIKTAEQVHATGKAKVEEYYFRRKGLGIATLLITVLAIALYLKIRSIGK